MVICDPGRHCIALHIEAFRGAAQWPLLVVPVRHVVIVDSPWPVPVAMYRNVLNRARLIAPMKMVCHSPTFRLLVLRVATVPPFRSDRGVFSSQHRKGENRYYHRYKLKSAWAE